MCDCACEDEISEIVSSNDEIRKLIEEVLGKYLAQKADEAVKGMMDRKSFPQFGNDIYGEMKKRELISVTKEL